MLHRRAGRRRSAASKIRELIRQQIDMLGRYECVDGGWAYYDIEVPDAAAQRLDDQLRHGHGPGGPGRGPRGGHRRARAARCDRAMASIRRQRKPDFSYCYGEYLKYGR